MYAPILNNLVVIGVFVWFIAAHGTHETVDTITVGQMRLLGIGTTAGVVAQALVLIPAAARIGYRLRPRRDLRGHGLGHAWRAGAVDDRVRPGRTSSTYVLVARLATSANTGDPGTGVGFSVYLKANLLFILPHSIVTVSIVTALLPRMSLAAHQGRMAEVAQDVSSGVRASCALVLPAAAAYLAVGTYVAIALYGWGNTSTYEAHMIGVTLQALSVGLVPFTVYYVLLRGFYSIEDTRTPFRINVVLNILNAALAVTLFTLAPARLEVPALGLALGLSYSLATLLSWHLLSHRLGGLQTYLTVRTLVRLTVAATVAFLPAMLLAHGISRWLGWGHLAVFIALLAGLALGGLIYIPLAARLRVPEVGAVLEPLLRRIPFPSRRVGPGSGGR